MSKKKKKEKKKWVMLGSVLSQETKINAHSMLKRKEIECGRAWQQNMWLHDAAIAQIRDQASRALF